MYKHARTFNRSAQLFKAMILSLIMFVCLIAAPILAYLMITAEESSQRPLFGLPLLAVIIIGIGCRFALFSVGNHTRCPLCSGQIFHNKRCLKHERAVKYPLVSYMYSMVIDMYIRRSFRCMFCGTAFRLRK